MTTPVTAVSGVGAQTAEILVENGFKSAEILAAAQEEELLKLNGFGPSKAKKCIEAAQALVGAVARIDRPESAVSVEENVTVEATVEAVDKAEAGEDAKKHSTPGVCTQKFSKKARKKKCKSGKSKKKKKKSSRKKK